MKRILTQKELKQEEIKTKIAVWYVLLGSIMFFLIIVQNIFADTITHKFKSPSFSGVGTSSHYLTIENQQYTRKLTIKEEIKALQDELEREKENSTLARFMRNLESRVYAELSRQLVNNLFGTQLNIRVMA
jgi:nitrogen fixation protein FixH